MTTEQPAADFTQVTNGWAWQGIARCWALIALAAALVVATSHPLSWVLAIVIIGIAQYHLSVLGHHATHRNLFNTLALNDRIARWLILAPLGLPLGVTRKNHFRHHTHFETPEDYEWSIYDMSRHHGSPAQFTKWLFGIYTGVAFALGVKRVLTGIIAARQDVGVRAKTRSESASSALQEWAIVALVQFILLALLTFITQSLLAYPLLWLLPIVTIMAGLSATRACFEHATLTDPPERLMTFPTGFLQHYVFGPFNFNYHAEHHRFPGVPACNLRRLHGHLVSTNNLGETKLCPSYLSRVKVIMNGLRNQSGATT